MLVHLAPLEVKVKVLFRLGARYTTWRIFVYRVIAISGPCDLEYGLSSYYYPRRRQWRGEVLPSFVCVSVFRTTSHKPMQLS